MKKINNFVLRSIPILVALLCMSIMGTSPLFADAYTKLMIHSDTADGSTTFTDSSTSGHTINWFDNVHHETDQAKFGQSSIYFDGTGDYLNVSNSDDFKFSNNFTVDFWVRPNTLPTTAFFDTRTSDSSNGLVIHIVSGLPSFYSASGGGFNGTIGISPDNWYHIALVRNGSAVKLYVNGTESGSGVNSNDFSNGNCYIGINNDLYGVPWDGYIDEFRVSKGIDRTVDATDPLYIPEGENSFTAPIIDYETFDLLYNGINTSFELEYSIEEMNQLAQLYVDGKSSQPVEELDLGDGITWDYLDGNLPGDTGGAVYDIGDSWIYEGKYYIKLGSGLVGNPLGSVPDIPAGVLPFIGAFLSFGFKRVMKPLQRK